MSECLDTGYDQCAAIRGDEGSGHWEPEEKQKFAKGSEKLSEEAETEGKIIFFFNKIDTLIIQK